LRNHADAEDSVQNALLKAYENIDGFEGRSRFSTWLFRIAVNEALMGMRREHRRGISRGFRSKRVVFRARRVRVLCGRLPAQSGDLAKILPRKNGTTRRRFAGMKTKKLGRSSSPSKTPPKDEEVERVLHL